MHQRSRPAVLPRGPHHAHNFALGGGTLDQAQLELALQDDDMPWVHRLVNDDIVQCHAANGTPD